MMYWIYDYASWVIGPLFVAIFIAVTWIGTFLTANFFVLYGILLGLLAVAGCG